MKPEAQRIAIAEACGWTPGLVKRFTQPWGCPPGGNPHKDWKQIPDYLNDLNACHEMEKTLDDFLFTRYCDELVLVIMGPAGAPDPIWLNCCNSARQLAVKATAAQRCEAFLKVKGLWTSDEPATPGSSPV